MDDVKVPNPNDPQAGDLFLARRGKVVEVLWRDGEFMLVQHLENKAPNTHDVCAAERWQPVPPDPSQPFLAMNHNGIVNVWQGLSEPNGMWVARVPTDVDWEFRPCTK